MNNNSRKKKTDKQSLYVTVVVIFMMVAVIVAVATSLARNPATTKKPDETTSTLQNGSSQLKDTDAMGEGEKEEDENVFLESDDKKEESDTKAEEKDTETEKTDDEKPQSTPTQNALPQFISPVMGELLRESSLETPVFSLTMEDFRTHNGVDLCCNIGSDVCAAADGTILKIWDDPMMGMSISVQHSGGSVSVYQNLADDIPKGIEEGKAVSKGQVIGAVGDTALLEIAEDSHLHFTLSVNGKAVPPEEYIEFAADKS